MNKMGLWFYLSLKRQNKTALFFLLLLLALPVGLWLLREAERPEEDAIAIALYAGEPDWNRRVADELISGEHSFEFYLSSSEEELREDVAARRAECGYIFSEDLLEKLESGRFKRSITLVTAPSTAVDKLSSEVVFSGLFTVWGRSLLETYSREGEVFQGEKEVWKRLEPMYDHYLENGSTFAFQYETEGRTQLGKPSMKQTFPARGLTAVFIFVMGLTAAVTVCEDEKRGLFSTLSGLGREAAVFSCLAAPVFLSCVSGFAALAAAGQLSSSSWILEGIRLIVYGGMCTLFSWGLCRIVKNPLAVACLIPFFASASLILCPVFIELSMFFPWASAAAKILSALLLSRIKSIEILMDPYYNRKKRVRGLEKGVEYGGDEF